QNAAQGSEGQVVFPVQIIETFCLIPQVLYLILIINADAETSNWQT
ncbi:hypothetical protein HNP69_002952, partial [Chryseobacterium koreense]|nr:hypothetical protein [Chryseobacterium koreense]